MFKALWLMIYPIVVFTRGPVLSDSTFCQVNGFFLAVGTEASGESCHFSWGVRLIMADFAVLQIALHTALYIFKPRAAGGEGGLYPYRKFAYIGWVVFPIFMASLAFINDQNAYVSQGTYCYLPIRPFWYRLALGWIPRYLIFVVILCIYASIYYYVRYKFHGFKKAGRSQGVGHSSLDSETPQRPPKQRHSLPPTPTLACHGLIPEPGKPSTSEEAPKPSLSAMESSRNRRPSVHGFMWASMMAPSKSAHISVPALESITSDTDSFTGPSTPHPLPNHASTTPIPLSHQPSSLTTPSRTRLTSWQDNFVSRFSPPRSGSPNTKPSTIDIFSVLRHPDGSDSPPIGRLELVNSHGQNLADVEMIRTRDKIRRQLRFLFIYPLVYIGMWIVPFVSHVLQYDDKFAANPPFGLSCATIIFLCSQAAVDCWLFSTREKPWRHIPGDDGSFWGSLRFWSGWKGIRKRRAVYGPGKTRDEMVREARVAYRRRDEELAQRRMELQLGPRVESGGLRGEREWWENRGDAAVSPVAEEIANPVEDITISEGSSTDEDATLTNVKTRSSKNTERQHSSSAVSKNGDASSI
jgi:G protein-coupled receptor GPR1